MHRARAVDIVKAGGLLVFRRCQQKIEYLMLKKPRHKLHWSPPKGHVDAGETNYDAAIRETFEEAALREEHLSIYKDKCWTLTYLTKGNRTKEVVYWLAQLRDWNTPIKLSNEHDGYKWVVISDALEMSDRANWPEMRRMLLEAEEHLRLNMADGSTTST
ncbi:bis(5'-nucleosyl)-tetraphosphatase [asymmetrical]-like [Asterias rubens]|uniref:bis(5'-nucleosyl)-tetraphosphatase [asymmetrical]-like n=1 Tax=Asterias rubens TaxID=7604 RepID=UPI0014553AA9|nr:bis(5'-nucleosyl)-tetraphosphatase [asymmetrical]-like [Asterias rubens]